VAEQDDNRRETSTVRMFKRDQVIQISRLVLVGIKSLKVTENLTSR